MVRRKRRLVHQVKKNMMIIKRVLIKTRENE
jgi:hypothetical protein